MKKIILLNILIVLGLLVGLEIICSFAFYIKDEKNPLVLSRDVTDFPYTYYTFLPQKKNGVTVVNNDGLYTHYAREKPAGTIRILLIGGSTARGIFSKETISESLEKSLQREFPGQRIEVVNAGMSGYVLEQLFIFYQLILSKYNPDIVVGLNGYNDLMSVKLNRYSVLYSAPQNFSQFQVIRQGKIKNTMVGRLSNIFPGIFRITEFLKRHLSGKSQYDYSAFDRRKIKEATNDYLSIVKDTHLFCAAQKVAYFEFLQPVRWYIRGDNQEGVNKGGVPRLIELYSSYEQGLTGLAYGYSLAGLFAGRDNVFRDDCHVSDEGAGIIALELFKPLKKELHKRIERQ